MALLALLAGGGNASAYQTPEADGIYYLYNTGCTSGEPGFMSTGNNYGFQVVVDKFGFPVKLIDAGNGNFKFQFIHHEGYLSDDGFMYSDGDNTGETPRARTITIQDQGDGKYKLINTSNSKEIENWYGNVVGDGEGNRRDYIWQFLSKAERDAIVAGYTTSVKLAAATSMGMPASVDTESEFDEYLSTNYEGIDQSSKITNGTFDTSHTTTDWSTTANANRDFNIGWGNEGTKNTPEVFQGAGYLTHTTITVDKVGLYKVSANALYRCGYDENNNRIGALGYDGSVAYLQANSNFAKVDDWYSGKINGNGPSGPTDANNNYFSQGKYLTEVYVYVDDTKTIDISLHSHAFTWGGWLIFNNFKLTYYSDEVSDDDAEALLATVPTAPMLKATKDALDLAQSNFENSQTIANYNALSTAIDNANASISVYAPLGTKLTEAATVKSSVSSNSPSYVTTFDSNIGTINTNYTGGLIAESDITTQIATVETEILNLVKSQTVSGSDMTRVIPNAACTSAVGIDNWKIEKPLFDGEEANDNEKFQLDTWATTSGMSVPMIEYWVHNGYTLQSNVIYQTISGLQKGVYTVTATTAVNNESNVAPNAGSALLFANNKTTDITTGGTETSFKGQTGIFSVNVVLTDADGGELKLGLKTVSPNYNWIAFKNFTLTYYGPVAEDADYTALQDAIDAAEAKTLGFEDGEYAPYSNVDALKALADAKAIDQKAPNTKTVVNNATSALTGATWTANVGEVNAFYKGDFDGYEEDTTTPLDYTPNGWTATLNFRVMLKNTENYPGLTDASAGTATMSWPGGISYGETAGYTMPLKANTVYRLQFKAAGWNNETRSGMSVSILNGTDGMALYNLGTPDRDINGNETNTAGMTSYDVVFATGAAGNYVFHIQSGNNLVVTDFVITKAANQYLNFADGSVPTYAPGTYPTVKISRTLTADRWATAVYPFAVSGVDNIAVLSSFNAETGSIRFESASQSVANEPFLMRSASGKSEISLSDIAVSATTETPTVTKNEASLIGAYNLTAITNAADNYVLSNNMIYAVGDDGANINPYRAYIQIAGGGGTSRSLVFLVDDEETTAIEDLNSERATTVGNIYNLNGQLVRKNADNLNGLRKGIYIVGGKRITVK